MRIQNRTLFIHADPDSPLIKETFKEPKQKASFLMSNEKFEGNSVPHFKPKPNPRFKNRIFINGEIKIKIHENLDPINKLHKPNKRKIEIRDSA